MVKNKLKKKIILVQNEPRIKQGLKEILLWRYNL